ncbi:Uu.00g084910.m01.CDS01 [Anthostomella pinea]|uniref:Uu.00g084910.m01.CDS01 n=1 Tax=Anthostomella pinea TaxID=933095 RepID=A0AAI8YJR2_9PEZI|nr:Uu.00g084910.m01.CDS01 [Anthostomella pinea]
MDEVLGLHHLRTTYAKENLARVSSLIGEPYLDKALGYMDEVVEMRKTRQGKEAPWTLMGMASKAVVLCALGRTQDAERIMLEILPIAERNFGNDHVGMLFGRQVLATIFIQQGRYAEAEKVLLEVADSQKRMSSRRGDYHPDRIATLIELARCYQLQGRLDESIVICDDTIQGLESISVVRQPFTETMVAARAKVVELKEVRGADGAESSGTAGADIKFPEHLFRAPRTAVRDTSSE